MPEKSYCNEGDKKIALIQMLRILENESDSDHPLTQQEILDKLNNEYGLVINDRKFVGRNLKLLREFFDSNPVSRNPACAISLDTDKRKGSYFSKRLFENSELQLLIDAVIASKYIPENYSKDLIEKLCALSNKYFKSHSRNIQVPDYFKTDNKQLFINIDVIDEAIEKGKKIVFDYNKYGPDKKLHKTVQHEDNPYRLYLQNQKYYLMYGSEKYKNIGFIRVDKITNIRISEEPATPITKMTDYKKGFDYKKNIPTLPYMFVNDITFVKFLADAIVVDDVVDYFGKEAKIKEAPEGKIEVTVHTSTRAMEYWGMQYLNYVEIVSPVELREKIKNNLAAAQLKYQ